MSSDQRTKVCVRLLPPDLSESSFLAQIEPFRSQINWFYFHPGKIRALRAGVRPGVAYLNFKQPTEASEFAAAFAGRSFTDSQGTEHRPEIEYAPYQRIPRARRPRDPKQNTIAEDPDYQSFLKSLQTPEAPASGDKQIEQRDAEKKVKEERVIPILEFFKSEATRIAAAKQARASSRQALLKAEAKKHRDLKRRKRLARERERDSHSVASSEQKQLSPPASAASVRVDSVVAAPAPVASSNSSSATERERRPRGSRAGRRARERKAQSQSDSTSTSGADDSSRRGRRGERRGRGRGAQPPQ